MSSKYLTLHTSDGHQLPARLRRPSSHPRATGVAVLCHPHPAFGGSMDVWLLPRLSERLAEAGWVALRFNFRAEVGDGRPATPDVAAAVDAGVAAAPHAVRVALVGWSLGALVALYHGLDDPRVTDWIGIAAPSRAMPPQWPAQPLAAVPIGLEAWQVHRSIVVGEHEQFFPADDAGAFVPHDVRIVPGADHFFFDRDDEVSQLVLDLLARS